MPWRAEPAIHPAGLEAIAGVCRAELRPGRLGDRLVVNLSYDVDFALRRTDFGARTLDLADPTLGYFLLSAEAITDALAAFATANRVRRICFIGASKGGFSAVMLGRLLAERAPDLRVGAVAFAPLVRLWPRNPRLTFPSYRSLIERAGAEEALHAALESHGDQRRRLDLPNLRVVAAWGVRVKRDGQEALGLKGSSVTLLPISYSFHAATTPFLCAGQPAATQARIIAGAAREGRDHEDLADDALAADEGKMAAEIAAMLPLPTVAQLVEHAIGPAPAQHRSWAARLGTKLRARSR